MSDAPAAPVTENGVPPAAQDSLDETPGFKVARLPFDVAVAILLTLFSSRSSLAILRTPLRMKG